MIQTDTMDKYFPTLFNQFLKYFWKFKVQVNGMPEYDSYFEKKVYDFFNVCTKSFGAAKASNTLATCPYNSWLYGRYPLRTWTGIPYFEKKVYDFFNRKKLYTDVIAHYEARKKVVSANQSNSVGVNIPHVSGRICFAIENMQGFFCPRNSNKVQPRFRCR